MCDFLWESVRELIISKEILDYSKYLLEKRITKKVSLNHQKNNE